MNLSEIITLRKKLHKYPELSGQEFETAKRIKKFIQRHHPTKIIENIGGTGLAAVYNFPKEGPVITIRCELDALPIQEDNKFAYHSKTKGVSHKCGHDGHMAMVAGLIFEIKEQSFQSGKVILLFQPAEENGEGAYRVIQDEKFQLLKTDYVFALHNIPKEPMHQIIVMDKGFSAEVLSFHISVNGKESHAAEPENGINPALALSEMIQALSELNISDPMSDDFAILTPVHIHMGQKSYGISPANGELHYTIRTWSTGKMDHLKAKIEQTFREISLAHSLIYQVEWFEHFPASANDPESNHFIEKTAKINHFQIQKRSYPFKFGEDFGWFSKQYKTGMFGLGSGVNTPALHNSDYDFPDEILETGIKMFSSIISEILSSKH